MKTRSTLRFSAPADLVSQMLIDPKFYTMIGEDLKAKDCTTVPGPDQISATYQLVTADVLRPVVGPESHLTTQLTWTTPLTGGRRQGELAISLERLPATFTAEVRLTHEAGLTVVTYDLTLKIKIPLLGGKLEKKAAEKLQVVIDAGQDIGQRWLADHGVNQTADSS